VKVRVPATTANLGPGFDVLALALQLYNTIEMEVASGKNIGRRRKLQIDIEGEGEAELPRDKRNIVYQAAKLVFKKFHFAPSFLHIRLKNRIPIASGLGSSAAARIGGLVGANRLCGERMSIEEILDLAAEIEGHADNVSAAMVGGLVVCSLSEGKEKRIEILKFNPPKNLSCVVCIPNFQLMTDRAREILPKTIRFEQAVFTSSRVALLLGSLIKRRYELLGMAMEDRLHQPYRKRLVKGMEKVFKEALKAGALGTCLSGAGPSILAFTASSPPSVAERVGKAMQGGFKRCGIESRYLILGIDRDGTRIA